ncbi:hypothetical protein ACHAWU_010263 [Discostella pseudostelligera]|uniref:Uncharacterized protein n=1 Tax=Discostella pseudostelligera TaxID=259834 RepID=A0ABD3M6T1_9STRA
MKSAGSATMSDTTAAASAAAVAAAAAAHHYQSGRYHQSLAELQRCHQLWEDERRELTLSVPPPSNSNSSPSPSVAVDGNGIDNEDAIIIAADIDDRLHTHRPRHRPNKRVELMALPLLARHADVAMVHFRRALQSSAEITAATSESSYPSAVGDLLPKKASVLSSNYCAMISSNMSSSSPSNPLVLWEEALSTNRIYRNSLLGAAASLIQSCGEEFSLSGGEALEERAAERVHNHAAIGQKHKRQRSSDHNIIQSLHHKSIRKAMKDTSLAMLMAAVAASHLHMYRHDGRSCNGRSCSTSGHRRNNNVADRVPIHDGGKKEDAWSVLVDAATKAAELMRIRKQWTDGNSTNTVNEDSVGAEKTKKEHNKLSSLEESLLILNKTLCINDDNDDEDQFTNGNATKTAVNDNDEIERGNLAMHTFRLALSVAALATGRLILPKLAISSRVEEAVMANNQGRASKRKRCVEQEEEINDKHNSSRLKVTEDEDGSMNFRYLHSSPMLHSRCKLVDALSFHLAAVRHPQRRKGLVELREVCFHEAIDWEKRAGSLYDVDVDDTDGIRAGYAWKIMNCVHGLEVASLSSNSHLRDENMMNDHKLQREDRERRRRVIASLELLASSSSRFANDWLGCVYATEEGEHIRALNKFQTSLDIGGRWSDRPDADEETDESRGFAERRTTVNLALCFLAMGEANAPLELLLHLWMTLSESSSGSSALNSVATPRPMSLLISTTGYEFECTDRNTCLRSDEFTRLHILWKLFQASSIAQDWSTCLNATEEIFLHGKDCCDQNDASRCELARAFGMLQCRRTSAAQDITHSLLQRLSFCGEERQRPADLLSASLVLSVAALYHADALLLNEQHSNYHDEGNTPSHCTQRSVAALDAGLRALIDNGGAFDAPSNAPLPELQVTAYNDHALSLLMSGDSVGALRYFREAAKLSLVGCRTQTLDAQSCWLLIPTYFNLSLLLMRDGHLEESAKSWLQLRGHYGEWQNALRGDDSALRVLNEFHATAIKRHALLVAKRSLQGDAMLWDQENILEWVPPAAVQRDELMEYPIRVGGVDALQTTALDALLLKYACSTAERKSSSTFRRRAGRLDSHR